VPSKDAQKQFVQTSLVGVSLYDVNLNHFLLNYFNLLCGSGIALESVITTFNIFYFISSLLLTNLHILVTKNFHWQPKKENTQ